MHSPTPLVHASHSEMARFHLPPGRKLSRNKDQGYNTYKFSCIYRSLWMFSAALRQCRNWASPLTHASPEEPAKGILASQNKNKRNLRIQLLLRKLEQSVRLHIRRCFSWNPPPMPEDLFAVREAGCWQTSGPQCSAMAAQLKKY